MEDKTGTRRCIISIWGNRAGWDIINLLECDQSYLLVGVEFIKIKEIQ